MRTLTFVASTLAVAGAANAAFVDVTVEAYVGAGWVANGYSGLTTYRVYANFTEESDGVTAVFGSADNPLYVNYAGAFYNDAIFGDTMLAPVDYTGGGFHWANQWDTYVTIGTDQALGNATALAPSTPAFGVATGNLGSGFTLTNEAWYITPADPQGFGTQVMLAQFTVDYGVTDLSGVFNLQDYNGVQYLDQAWAVPAPGALALLGLAGLAGRRRR